MSTPAPPPAILICKCCLLNFDPKKLSQAKRHLINNLPFCNHCRESYRNIWQDMSMKCQEKLKKVYQEIEVSRKDRRLNCSKNFQLELDASSSGTASIGGNIIKQNASTKYAAILINEINLRLDSAAPPCKNDYKLSDLNTTCSFNVKRSFKCSLCIFKRMLYLTKKMPVFRYSSKDFSGHINLWKHFFSYNAMICQVIIDKFEIDMDDDSSGDQDEDEDMDVDLCVDIEVEDGQERDRGRSRGRNRDLDQDDQDTIEDITNELQTLEVAPFKIPPEVENTVFNESFQKLYQVFRQIHTDQQNSCFYLEGIYENPSFLIKKYGANIDSKELISITSCRSSKINENNIMNYWDDSDFKFLEFIGDYSFVKEKIKDYLPLKTSQSLFLFFRIALLHVSPDKKAVVGHTGTRLVSLAIEKYLNSTSKNLSLHYDNLLKSAELLTIMEEHSVTLQFLWSFDHKTGKFYLNEHSHFDFNTIKTKILFYYSQNNAKNAATNEHNEQNEQSRSQQDKDRIEAEIQKFILDLYTVSKSLSMRPKFQLVLISLAYMVYASLKYMKPLYVSQTSIDGYFTPEQNYRTSERICKAYYLASVLKKFLVYFDLNNVMDILEYLIPKAVKMDLFVLSDSTKNMNWDYTVKRYEERERKDKQGEGK